MTHIVQVFLIELLVSCGAGHAPTLLPDPLAPVSCSRTADCVGERSFGKQCVSLRK